MRELSGRNVAADFFTETMSTNWQKLLTVCDSLRVDPAIVVRPRDFQDQVSARDRGVVIRELEKEGLSAKEISLLVPLTPRAIRLAISFKRQANASANASVT